MGQQHQCHQGLCRNRQQFLKFLLRVLPWVLPSHFLLIPAIPMAGDAKPSDGHEEQAQQPASAQEDEQQLPSGKGEDEAEGDDQGESGKELSKKSPPKSRKRGRKAEAATPASDRPARERKSVKRYSASPSGGTPAAKALTIVKGSGTQLKDIPNVAFKLSKMKPDGNLQALHSVLFGKKAKAHSLKRNIGQFSGFVWSGDEEKQRAKLKDKLDKFVKEKMVYFCDVLNIPINKATMKKEDLSVKLLDFLESPHPTTDVLLADKEQGQKRKRKSASSKSLSSGDVSAEGTEKKRKKRGKVEEKKKTSAAEEDTKDDDNMTDSANRDDSSEDNEKDKVSEEEVPQTESKSEEEEDTKEEEEEIKGNASVEDKTKDGNGGKSGNSTKQGRKGNNAKSSKSPSTSRNKYSSLKKNDGKTGDTSGSPASVRRSDSKKKAEKDKEKDQDASLKEKSASKKQSSKSPVKASQKDQGKGKPKKAAKAGPSREEIHEVVVKILKEVDFNTSTLSDILKQLGAHFDVDLYSRKTEVKEIIADVISNMSDDEDEGDEDEEDAENGDEEDAKNDDAEDADK